MTFPALRLHPSTLVTLPVHPRTGLAAVGLRRDGRPIWPILGGAEDGGDGGGEGGAGSEGAGGDAGSQSAGGSAGAGTEGDFGFPANTPVAAMTKDQQLAYWRHNARKHEDLWRSVESPENLRELQRKAAAFEQLERESMTEKEREVAKAREEALTEGQRQALPRLFKAEFRAEAKGRIDEAKIADIIAPLNVEHFLDASGDIDTDKVRTFIDGIAPAASGQQERRGPSPAGQGSRGSSTEPSVASGRDLYNSRHGRRTS